jgi:tight adherence protein B
VRKLAPALGVTVLAALLLAAPAVAGSGDARLTRVSKARFPERAFVLTLPTRRTLLPATVEVKENGRSVSRPSVVPADAAGENAVATVLVIDASASMRGRPIVDAMAAARAFAKQRSPQQQIGVVTFNRTTTVAQPLTTDESALHAALSDRPALDDGTHLYDAVSTAVGLLDKAQVKAGSVVLLSDGADTGSGSSADQVAAEAAGVRIFSVGLRSGTFDRAALEDLAATGRGEYVEASSSAGLRSIYGALAARLASEYVISYRSRARLGKTVQVELTAPGLVARTEYTSPAAPVHKVEKRQAGNEFWASSVVLVVVSIVCALLIGIVVVMLLALRPSGRSVQQRLGGFVSVAGDGDEGGQAAKGKMLEGAEKSLEQTQWWARVKEELEIAGVEMPAVRLLGLTAVGTVLAMWVFVAFVGSALGALFALGVPAGVWSVITRRADRQRKLFSDQLADNLQVIASAMRAGHSFVGALSVAVRDAPEPAQSEFQRAIADEKLGVPLEDTLGVIAGRMQSRDLEQVVLVAQLQRATGGNTAEVIDRVSDTIRHRSELRRMISTLTTQGRMARWIVSLLPPGLLTVITVLNPEYMKPLIATTAGHVLLALGTVMVVAGSLVIKKIVNIDV